nr:MAG: hypothetical protein [Bacteriophage sp.]
MKEKDYVLCNCGKKIYEGDKVFWASRYKSKSCIPTCSIECFEKFKQYQINILKEKLKEIENQTCEEDIY